MTKTNGYISNLPTISTRALRRGHSLSQHAQFLKNNMIAENDFLWNFDTIDRTTRSHLPRFDRVRSRKFSKKVCLNRLEMLWNA